MITSMQISPQNFLSAVDFQYSTHEHCHCRVRPASMVLLGGGPLTSHGLIVLLTYALHPSEAAGLRKNNNELVLQ